MSAIDVFRQEAEQNGWTVEPHGYYRQFGVTAYRGSHRVYLDLDRRGRVISYAHQDDDSGIRDLSWSNETGKLASAIQLLERQPDE